MNDRETYLKREGNKVYKGAKSHKSRVYDKQQKSKYVIEFDNIHDINVFVNGREVAVSKLFIDWKTNTEHTVIKHFKLRTVNKDKGFIEETAQDA